MQTVETKVARLISVIDACLPRSDILSSEFNPEIFTPDLGEVIRSYKGRKTNIAEVYTDADRFFTDGTYPTEGLLNLFRNVLRRVTLGDGTAPATTRLESSFGGGKTHGLIGVVHLVKRGSALKHFVSFLEPDLLPAPGSIRLAGIVGSELDLHREKAEASLPHTLWGEIALQLGGESLYDELGPEALSLSAPGRHYFEKVLADKPCVILIDELAQYAARVKIEYPGTENQIAAFLMAIMSYAAAHKHVALVITLSGAADAFGDETDKLRKSIERETGIRYDIEALDRDIRQAAQSLRTISARQELSITPVKPDELSKIMAKRLFENIDYMAAEDTAQAYCEMYAENDSIPQYAKQGAYRKTIEKHYPFHPTLIDLLERKLSAIPTFQRTRGLLRVLTLALRAIWEKELEIPLIHSSHMDLYDGRLVDELFGRTNRNDLKAVLTADVGGSPAGGRRGGLSKAQQLDLENPHPRGYPVHEWCWKVVLLHSLVGREGEHGRAIFGITKEDALLEISFPGMGPSQVARALKRIKEEAFYLRENTEEGRYFASLEPTLNKILVEVESEVTEREIDHVIDSKIKDLAPGVSDFKTYSPVRFSSDIDDQGKEVKLGIIDLNLKKISVEDFFTTVGNKPRKQQNTVFLLVPCTVKVVEDRWTDRRHKDVERELGSVRHLARSFLALKKVLDGPERHGLTKDSEKLSAVKKMIREKDLAVKLAVASLYDSLWYPGPEGKVIKKEIKGGIPQGGLPFGEEIKRVLFEDGKLLTIQNVCTREAIAFIESLLFTETEEVAVGTVKRSFRCNRSWPIYIDEYACDELFRMGLARGVWGLYQKTIFGVVPDVYISYGEHKNIPPSDISPGDDWVIIGAERVEKRGWLPEKGSMGLAAGMEDRETRVLRLENPGPVVRILSQLNSLYRQGATSEVTKIVVEGLGLPGGGSLHLAKEKITPADLLEIGELFKVLGDRVVVMKQTRAFMEIRAYDKECPLFKRMRNLGGS